MTEHDTKHYVRTEKKYKEFDVYELRAKRLKKGIRNLTEKSYSQPRSISQVSKIVYFFLARITAGVNNT